jgi:hypothetical protein
MSIERTGFEISMTADATGVVKGSKEAADALGQTADKTKELNTALEEGKGKLEQEGKGLHEGGEHARLFAGHHHEAHAAVKALGEVIPGVGQMARELFNVWTVGISAAGALVGYLIEQWRELGREQDKQLADAAKGFGHLKELQEQARTDAAAARGELEAELARANESVTSLETIAQRRVAIYEAQIAAAKKLADAQDELEKQRIREGEQTGAISHQVAGERLANLEIGARRRNAAGGAATEEFRLRSMEAELDSAHLLQPQAQSEFEAARDRAAAMKTEAKNLPDIIKSLTESLIPLHEEASKLRDDLASAKQTGYRPGFPGGLANPEWMAEQQAKLNDAQLAVTSREQLVEQTQRKILQLAETLPQAESEAGAAHARLQNYENLSKNLPGQIETGRTLQGIHQGGQAAVESTQAADALARSVQTALNHHKGDLAGSYAGNLDKSLDLRLIDIIHQFFIDNPRVNGQEKDELDARLTDLQREVNLLNSRGAFGRHL